jgi:hypothetical protein
VSHETISPTTLLVAASIRWQMIDVVKTLTVSVYGRTPGWTSSSNDASWIIEIIDTLAAVRSQGIAKRGGCRRQARRSTAFNQSKRIGCVAISQNAL